jgi:hypothetical protein
MAPTLFLAMRPALLRCPILLAGMPTLPAPSLLLTCFTAKTGSPMPRPEQPFASFEQTLPGPMRTALWPLADVPKKMTLVHGRVDSRCSSLGAKRQLRSEAFYPLSPSILLYKMCRIARSTAGAVARPNARFWPAFKARLTLVQARPSIASLIRSKTRLCPHYSNTGVRNGIPRHYRRSLLESSHRLLGGHFKKSGPNSACERLDAKSLRPAR